MLHLRTLSAQRFTASPHTSYPKSFLAPSRRSWSRDGDHLKTWTARGPRNPLTAPQAMSRANSVRDRAYDTAVKLALSTTYGIMTWASAGARLIYQSALTPQGTQAHRNVSYVPSSAPPNALQTLDILAPPGENLPVVVYIHGGAFVNGSKDSHWMMPLPFLHAGCLVVNINYRLAPKAPFPAALEDTCLAVGWVLDHIGAYGGDPTRLILAGESAGGNLATAACACMCWPRSEPFARALFDRGVTPCAVLPNAATYSMSKFDNYAAPTPQDQRAADLLKHINNYYLRAPKARTGDMTLANPLQLCAADTPPVRPLPPFFITAGSLDPLLEDSHLAATCLRGAGAEVETKFYEGGVHVFHALYFTPSRYLKIAIAHWIDTIRFLKQKNILPRKPEAADKGA